MMNSLLNYLFLASYKYAYYSKTEFIQTSVIHITSCLDTLRKNSRLFVFKINQLWVTVLYSSFVHQLKVLIVCFCTCDFASHIGPFLPRMKFSDNGSHQSLAKTGWEVPNTATPHLHPLLVKGHTLITKCNFSLFSTHLHPE